MKGNISAVEAYLNDYRCISVLLTFCMWGYGPLDAVMKGPGKPAREMCTMYL